MKNAPATLPSTLKDLAAPALSGIKLPHLSPQERTVLACARIANVAAASLIDRSDSLKQFLTWKALGLIGFFIVFSLALVGAKSGSIYPSPLDATWLTLLCACSVFALETRDFFRAIMFSTCLAVFVVFSQAKALSLLGTTYGLSEYTLLDELWIGTSFGDRLQMFSVLGLLAFAVVYFLVRKRFAFVAGIMLVLSLPNFAGYYGVGERWLDQEDWQSVSTVCFNLGLFDCIWERSNRDSAVRDLPDESEVQNAMNLLLKVDTSLRAAAGKPRNIYYLSLESAFDFFPFWDRYRESFQMLPEHYRQWVTDRGALTAPGFAEKGSFDSRFVSLCASRYALPPKITENFPCLPRALAAQGYATAAFDEAYPTYDLDVLYRKFGFDQVRFEYAQLSGYAFYQSVLDSINFNEHGPRFVFVFPFTGHHGPGMKSLRDRKIPEGSGDFAAIFDNDKAIIGPVSVIEYAARFTDDILKRDPTALVVWRNDHLLPSTVSSIFENPHFPGALREQLHHLPPFLQRFMVVSNDPADGHKYPRIISPQSIPVTLLEMAGLNPDSTAEGRLLDALSCRFPSAAPDLRCDYRSLYRIHDGTATPVPVSEMPENVGEARHAKGVLSLDLYFGQQYAYRH